MRGILPYSRGAEQENRGPSRLRGLILDYGDVLSRPQRTDSLAVMAARVGVSLEAFKTAYWAPRREYDGGLSAADYWKRVFAALKIPGDAADRLVAWLIARDVESWTDYREETWELARAFRAAGGRTAFLSNGVPEIVGHLRTARALDGLFDAVIVSCEVDCLKPDPRIFRLCLERLGVGAEETLFVDDRLENVESASRLGLRTLHFVGDDAVGRLRAAILP
jgi:putative hydrolase of the HAD superfamily